MKIKKRALDGINEIMEDTETGITATTLLYTYKPIIRLYDGEECIATYETEKDFIEDYKKMKQDSDKIHFLVGVVEELEDWLYECLNILKQNDIFDRTEYETGQIRTIECIIEKIKKLKGSDKE